MKNLFVPYKQSLALKELGFDELCFGFWDFYCNKERLTYPYIIYSQKQIEHYFEKHCSAPMLQQAFDWFRKKHKINIQVAYCEYAIKSCNGWYYTFDNPTGNQSWNGKHKSYYKAMHKAIEAALKLI